MSLNEYGVPENSVIIAKNSKIPCTYSQSYGTVRDNQNTVNIQILQGDAKDPEDCGQLGNALIENIPPSPQGSEVEITFAYDANGILNVTEIFVPTGQKIVTTIQVQETMSPEATQKSKKDINDINIE